MTVSATQDAPKRPLNRRIQAFVMGKVNVPMRILLGLPFATPLSERLMLVSFTGRRTGRRYRQPLSYVPDGNTLLTPGGGNWKLNLRDDEPVRLRLRGRDVVAWPEVVSDLDEVERLLQVMTAANPSVGRFVGLRKRPDGRIDRIGLENAVRHGFRVVRWHLDGKQGERIER